MSRTDSTMYVRVKQTPKKITPPLLHFGTYSYIQQYYHHTSTSAVFPLQQLSFSCILPRILLLMLLQVMTKHHLQLYFFGAMFPPALSNELTTKKRQHNTQGKDNHVKCILPSIYRYVFMYVFYDVYEYVFYVCIRKRDVRVNQLAKQKVSKANHTICTAATLLRSRQSIIITKKLK